MASSGLKHALKTVIRVASNPRIVAWEFQRAAVFRRFKRQYGQFLTQGTDRTDPNKTVLVINFNNGHVKAQIHSMLAKALQLHGYTPVIVTYRWCADARRYHRVFGFDRFEFFDEYIARVPRGVLASIQRDASSYLEDSLSVKAIKSLEYRGVNIGRPTLSSISRDLFRGRVALSNEAIRSLLRRWLPLTMQRVHAAEDLLDHVRPGLILLHEKGYIAEAPVFEVALNRGINNIYWCHAHRDDALVLKRYTSTTKYLQPVSLSQETWEVARRIPWTAQHELELAEEFKARYKDSQWFLSNRYQDGKQLKSKEEVQNQLGLDRTKKTAVVFAHMAWDASFFHGEDLFEDYEEWLVETTKVACQNPAVNWVIKLHPFYVYKSRADGFRGEASERAAIREQIGPLPAHVKLLDSDTDINTFSLFAVTDYCLTVRGTIGIEMACFGIPIFTGGTGRYTGFGFTIDSDTRKEYLEKLRRIQQFPKLTPEQTELAKKYAYTLFRCRPARFETFRTVFRHHLPVRHPLFWDLEIAARSFRDVMEAPDLRAFAEWALDSRQADFLMTDGGTAQESLRVG